MHSTRISTLGCLFFQISMAHYGHASEFENSFSTPSSPSTSPMTSPTSEVPPSMAIPSAPSVTPHSMITHKQSSSYSLPVATNGTVSLVVRPRWKKCTRGIKSRYCRSYHRNLLLKTKKLDLKAESSLKVGAVKAVSIPTTVVPPVVPTTKSQLPSTITIPKIEIPPIASLPKIEVPSTDISLKSGDATYYGTGMGACGIVSNDNSMIAAASQLLFDTFPGATPNPNLNPICGRKVKATYQGNSVEVEVVDRCVACAVHDLDFSPAAFAKLGAMEKGRLHGMTWEWM
ncbi:hypothetical protein MJO28_006077 [Puccinia striiformis f. sp. tritici]|uniref:Uncharacterized protein n=1 Tax=Puccinia striiformis f. sp. tritici TaxID=168172 RepID=A0ACC0EGE9_9BASI|nr:hypothetical protein Pst134EB_012279 [Puccinia striiformis f. sp. tritici]KAI7953530.1 hypothetical protein MJO28_006077 [Puccinia striiformis f. sp. tritici]KAI7957873.1 hypothetical protein MJO29_006090 [Puccinia striiformis f. sp. tritici]KAI9604913.1 hypothetical protein H4Q26_002883 [Puccinia striiformis f. sp. tritici PST-130]